MGYYLALARVLGCRHGSIQLELATTPADESAADRAWNELGLAADERPVCLNTGGAFGPAKNWPAAYFAELATRLTNETGVAVLVLCGPAERAAAAEITRLADHPRVVSLAEQPLSLGLSKACVRRAALLITTDSGPRHFAAAFQTPVITLFGPTHIAWTRTSHPHALHVLHPVPCGPCQRPICPEGHHRCMRELTPDHVLRATLSFLETGHGTHQQLQSSWFGTESGDQFMATWLITGATGFLGRHVLDVLDSELASQVELATRSWCWGGCPAGWPEHHFVEGRSRRSHRPARNHQECGPGPCHPHRRLRLHPRRTMRSTAAISGRQSVCSTHCAGLNRRVRVTLAGSAAELGAVPPSALPVAESYPCAPLDAYGRSKLLATVAGLAERPPLELAVARVFNPIGPGLPATQAFGEFAAQLTAEVADPLPLLVGNLEARRDFIDVRDVARALIAISLHGQPGLVYHVGSGQSRAVGEGLDVLIRLSGRSVKLCVDPRRHVRKGPLDSRADIRPHHRPYGMETNHPFRAKLGRPVERPENENGSRPIQP